MINQFRALALEDIARELQKAKNTLILYHVRPDADAVGSAFALRELLRVMGVPVWCACSDELPSRLEFLADGTQGSVLLEDDMKIDYERIVAVDSASPSQLGSLFGRLRRDVDIMIDHHASGQVYADYYIDPSASATGEIICKIAEALLSKASISYTKVLAEENVALAEALKIKQAPTLVQVVNGEATKFVSVPEVKKFIQATASV